MFTRCYRWTVLNSIRGGFHKTTGWKVPAWKVQNSHVIFRLRSNLKNTISWDVTYLKPHGKEKYKEKIKNDSNEFIYPSLLLLRGSWGALGKESRTSTLGLFNLNRISTRTYKQHKQCFVAQFIGGRSPCVLLCRTSRRVSYGIRCVCVVMAFLRHARLPRDRT